MRMFLLTIVILTFGQYAASNYANLAGHQVWKLKEHGTTIPMELMIDGLVDVLDHSHPMQKIRVTPEHAAKVRKILKLKGLSHEVLVEDLADHLEVANRNERATRDVSATEEKCEESNCPKPLVKSYMSFQQMERYLKTVNETHSPNVFLSSIGKSHEDRDIYLLEIKSPKENPKTVWIEGGIHAREWISPAVAFGLIDKLVNDDEAKKLLEHYDFIFTPMANPDGYEFSRTTDRYWRKNRSPNSGSVCKGVDLNRNWDFHYGVGASSYPCSEVFKGSKAFSEPETNALQAVMEERKDDTLLVLSLHSYGDLMLYPWGWTDEDPPNKKDLLKIGNEFLKGAKKNGENYQLVNSANGMYYASGATDDWALGKLGTKYVYTLELRGHDFLLAADAIEPNIDEVWVGLQKALDSITKTEL